MTPVRHTLKLAALAAALALAGCSSTKLDNPPPVENRSMGTGTGTGTGTNNANAGRAGQSSVTPVDLTRNSSAADDGSPNVVYEAMATRLPTVIWATVGTEAIEGWGIHRLETRRMEDLVDLMERLATAGAPVVSERLDRQEVAVPSEHPLVTFYKKLLPSAEEPQERCSSSASPGR